MPDAKHPSTVRGSVPDTPGHDFEGALHEVSNALTVLLGWVAEARAPGATAEEVEHALRIVEQRARAARDLARRAIGAEVPASREAELGEVLRGAEEALRVEAERAGIRLVRRGDDRTRVPLGEDVSQIVTNLVLNALAHAPRGSEVRIVSIVSGAQVTVEVEDDGPGIPDERSSTVFEGDTTRTGGAGVGLRHARAMARAAGGDLALASDPDGGARFRLTWPRAEEPRAGSPSRSTLKAAVLAGSRVLILEDDADVTDLLEAALSARGAHVTVARTAGELASHLRADHDAVLVDLSPIAADVQGALDLVRRQAERAAIVFITGSADALPEGSTGALWVRKPFEVGEIVSALLEAKRRA